jgi:hypothetical protein
MNYGELKADFLGLLKRRDITDTQADNFLRKAVNRVQRVLRIPPMEKSIAVTYDGDVFTDGQLPIPSDYLRLISMSATPPGASEKELHQSDLQTVLDSRQSTGRPTRFVRRGGYWVFGPSPVTGTVFRIDYYDEFPSFTNSTSNYLTNGAGDLITNAALVFACTFFNDKRRDQFELDFQTVRLEIEEQAAQDTLINAVVSAAYVFPED